MSEPDTNSPNPARSDFWALFVLVGLCIANVGVALSFCEDFAEHYLGKLPTELNSGAPVAEKSAGAVALALLGCERFEVRGQRLLCVEGPEKGSKFRTSQERGALYAANHLTPLLVQANCQWRAAEDELLCLSSGPQAQIFEGKTLLEAASPWMPAAVRGCTAQFEPKTTGDAEGPRKASGFECPGGARSIQALRAQLKTDWNKAYRGEDGKSPSQGLEPATPFVN